MLITRLMQTLGQESGTAHHDRFHLTFLLTCLDYRSLA